MRRFFPVLAAVLAAGCGYEGEPLPPLANIPSAVGDLSAVQRGGRIIARFTVPRQTTEGVAITRPLKLDLRIGPPTDPLQEDAWAAGATPVPPGAVQNGGAYYEIASGAWTGKDAVLGVRVTGANGKSSRWSNLVTVPVVAPPETPAEVRAEPTAQGVQLSWQARGNAFRIFRRSGTGDFMPVADVPQPPWTDSSTVYGTMYAYRVQTIAKLEGNHEAESELSEPASVTPVDRFPPAPPAGLRVTASPNSMELSWDNNTEPDLAGYRIYRAAPGGAFERIAETSTVPTYSDHAVERGKTYRYAITAFDQSGNESEKSAAVEGTFE